MERKWANGRNWWICLLYTSDAADERSSVDLGGRRIIKKKKHTEDETGQTHEQQTITEEHMTETTTE